MKTYLNTQTVTKSILQNVCFFLLIYSFLSTRKKISTKVRLNTLIKCKT